MNYKAMGRIMSQILMLEALFMLPPLLLSIYDGTQRTGMAFLYSMGIILLVAAAMHLASRGAKKMFFAREGVVCVGLSWIVISLLGCLPFWFSGEIPAYIDAFFEIVSGFTTTGASVVLDVERLSRPVLYWRSFSHWLGGMGVLVFLLAVSPSGQSGGFTLHLLRAESPGPNVGKLVPRMRQTAEILYMIYILLTILNVAFLLFGGMPVFDAICTAFGTAGTGGFGIKKDSIAGYSPYLQNVCTVFMLLFGINFNCYYLLLMRQYKSMLKNEELRLYLGIAVGSTLLIVWNLRGFYPTLRETFRHAAFQVSSIMTTPGFATTDFDRWPSFCKAILLSLMVIGACAGSTGGGIKCARVLLFFKELQRNVRQLLHPQKIQAIRCDGQIMDEKILNRTNIYLSAYTIIIVISFLLVSIDGLSPISNFSAVLACFNNIGPGMEAVGPTANFGGFSVLSKIVLILDMLAGRLEIFPILVLFSGRTWKEN